MRRRNRRQADTLLWRKFKGFRAMKRLTMAATSGLALSAFLLAAPALAQGSYPAPNGDRVDANGMPTTHSTPAEHAATAELNNEVAATDGIDKSQGTAASDAQYQAQQQQYQNAQQDYQQKVQDNQAAQQDYQNRSAAYADRVAAYETLRDRYAAERAAYHRGIWPDRYARWTLDDSEHLIGQRVQILGGDRVGTVTSVARNASGRVEGLEVSLDNGHMAWIDRADVRYDRADSIVATNLDRHDLYRMAEERL
jgi:hypothetical protein